MLLQGTYIGYKHNMRRRSKSGGGGKSKQREREVVIITNFKISLYTWLLWKRQVVCCWFDSLRVVFTFCLYLVSRRWCIPVCFVDSKNGGPESPKTLKPSGNMLWKMSHVSYFGVFACFRKYILCECWAFVGILLMFIVPYFYFRRKFYLQDWKNLEELAEKLSWDQKSVQECFALVSSSQKLPEGQRGPHLSPGGIIYLPAQNTASADLVFNHFPRLSSSKGPLTLKGKSGIALDIKANALTQQKMVWRGKTQRGSLMSGESALESIQMLEDAVKWHRVIVWASARMWFILCPVVGR